MTPQNTHTATKPSLVTIQNGSNLEIMNAFKEIVQYFMLLKK